MKLLKKIWNNISFSGINRTLNSDLKKKIILTNNVAALAFCLIFLMSFNYLKIPTLFAFYILAATIYASPILFNRLQWYEFSRLVLAVTPPLFILIGSGFITQGPSYGGKYALISTIITPVILYQQSEKRKMWLGIIWVIIGLILYDPVTSFINRFPEITDDSEFENSITVTGAGVMSIIFFVVAFQYLMQINDKYEKKLNKMLENTKQKNQVISQKNTLLERQYDEQKKQQYKIEQMNQILRSQVLKAQINPHFIFNCLNSIQHFIMQSNADSAMTYMSKFSKLMRQVLENSTNEDVPVIDEIKTLTYYIELEQLRYNSFDFEFVIDEQIDQFNTEIPSMLLQPFVENSIIHGLRNKKERGHLKIIMLYQHSHILCIIEDNGIGRAAAAKLKLAKNTHHKSRAMDINTERIALMEKNAGIITQDLEDEHGSSLGTRVEINIPISV